MNNRLLASFLVSVVCASILVPAGLAARQLIVARIGPADSISLKLLTAIGYKRVSTLPHGSYTVRVEDRSRTGDVHLVGPGIDRHTSLAFVGAVSWPVRLAKGTYTVRSDSGSRTVRFHVR
jgi:hypothetical protein